MDKTSSRFRNIESTIVNILNDQYEKCLKVQLSRKPDNISTLINYLKHIGWCNYKFNEYSIKNHVNETFDEVLAASKGSPFENHFMQKAVQEHVREVIRKDMQSIVEIERSWHKDQMKQ